MKVLCTIKKGTGCAAVATGLLLSLACTPDLHETVGPIIRGPNVTGTVFRNGIPVPDVKVKLEITDRDSTSADDRTDGQGRFGFVDVGIGSWTIRADSSEPTDFDKVTYDFTFLSPDTAIEVTAIELSLDGLRLTAPEEDARVLVPRFTRPITFEWTRPNDPQMRNQIRLFGPDGGAFWYSDPSQEESARWNGIGNRGENVGKLAEPGSYQWRIRVENPGTTVESSTAYRRVEFTEEG